MTEGLDWHVAIIGFDPIQWARCVAAWVEKSGKSDPLMDDGRRKTHIVQYVDLGLRRSFYQALLKITWLPPKIRSEVMSELGLSLQKQKSDDEKSRTVVFQVLIDHCKAQMRANKERPQGGIHDAAVAKIAATLQMTPEALKRRITRHKKRPRK
jgi:hypothetical protein